MHENSICIVLQATLKVDNSQRIMIFGQSKDFGTCRSMRKSGEKCTAFVNTNRCEYCIYHVKQEYQKCSSRSELQSSFAGRGLVALRNKVLGKNEVFYAGKSYTAIPAAKSKKLLKKDESRLKLLSGATVSSTATTKKRATEAQIKKRAAQVEASQHQRQRDLDILRKLGGLEGNKSSGPEAQFALKAISTSVTLEESKKTALDVIAKLKAKQNAIVERQKEEKLAQPPKIKEFESGEIDLSIDFKNLKTQTENNSKAQGNDLAVKEKLIEPPPKKTEFESGDIHLNIDSKTQTEITQKTGKINELESDQSVKTQTQHDLVAEQKIIQPPKTIDLSINFKEIKTQTKIISEKHEDDFETKGISKNTVALKPILSSPFPKRKADRAKLTALQYVQKNGPIEKIDPNSTRGSKKRVGSTDLEIIFEDRKRQKKVQENEFYSEKFKKMMAMTSRNADLLELRDDEEREKYFDKMEMKEKMEEKMMSTYKVPCKAVRCLKCKYTSFSAADRCKTERHPLKVADAVKRFFKCGDCGNRTACLEIVPTKSCNNCGGAKWERTTMMKERIVSASQGLSIRGGEQKFVNSVVADANINLLVPDE